MQQKNNNSGIWILLISTATFFAFVLGTAKNPVSVYSAMAFGFQLLCWCASATVVVKASGGEVRVSNPLLLLLLWCFLYLILPSTFWLQNENFTYVDSEKWISLQWLHGLFILGLLGGYLLTGSHRHAKTYISSECLPAGNRLFLIGLAPVLLTILLRLLSGNGIFPDTNYGENWYELHEKIKSARQAGGVSYLLVQIQSKLWFFPILLQSIGLGLILSHAIRKGNSVALTIAFAGAIVLFNLLFGSGGRSSAVIIGIISVLVIDLTTRQINFGYIAGAIILGLFLFDFWGILRTVPANKFISEMPKITEKFMDPRRPRMGEFSAMLSKEALMIKLVDQENGPQPVVLLQEILRPIPSQLNPRKYKWRTSSDILSEEIIGDQAKAGGGVAGTFVGDSYRIGGWLGVPMMASLLGIIIGSLERWVFHRHGQWSGANIIKLCLWAGFLGWAFVFIRADLGEVITILLYYFALPWMVLQYLLPSRKNISYIE